MLDDIFFFPGLPWVSNILAAIIIMAFEIAAFVLTLAVLKYYVTGQSVVSRITGCLLGILMGVFFARGYTGTFRHYWALPDALISIVLVGFILLNAVVVSAVYTKPRSGGPHAP